MKLNWENVKGVLEQCGPMTMREVATYFPDVPYQNVGSVISAMRIRVGERQIHIHSWTRESIGKKYLRAVYALGNKRDASKPPLITDKERSKTWRARHKVPQVVANSVFNWGRQQ
jgi:hypothetical protein